MGCNSNVNQVSWTVYTVPVADAGSDQAQCNNSTFNMAAVPSVGTGAWTFVGPDGGATITDPSSATTTVTDVPYSMDITLRWTETNGPCSDFDDVVIRNNPLPVVNAITGVLLTYTGFTTDLDCTPGVGGSIVTAVWSSANTGIATVNASTGVVTGEMMGTVTISYTITDINGCVNTSTVNVVVDGEIIDITLRDDQPTLTPAGNKLKVRFTSVIDIANVFHNYTEGKLTLRTPNVAPLPDFTLPLATNPYNYKWLDDDANPLTPNAPIINGGFAYYVFGTILSGEQTIDAVAGVQEDLFTLVFDCDVAGRTFAIVHDKDPMDPFYDPYVTVIGGEYYQELFINGQPHDQARNAGNTVVTPAVLSVSETHIHELCGSLGSIDITVMGGYTPYTYNWGGGITTQDRSGLSAGTYTVTVTDANGCTTSTSVIIMYLPVHNTTADTYHATIQAGIDAADAGATLSVCAGTFNENVNVTEEVTIIGAGKGSDPLSNTVLSPLIDCTGTGFTISAANVTIQDMYVTNYLYNVLLSSAVNPTINNMALIDYCQYGIRINGVNSSIEISETDIQRTTLLAGTVGIRVGEGESVNGMLIEESTITGNALQGIVVFQSATPVDFDDITIRNSIISDNAQKGVYFEKLSNAIFEDLTMDNNGTDVNYNHNAGIDINLKYSDYSNITIQDCDITNSGVYGTAINPEQAAAVMIKARDDGGSYGPNPATLTNVTIKNNLITGPENGIRFGEFGTTNATPTNITVEGNDLSDDFANKALISRIGGNIVTVCNWHGSTDNLTIWGGFNQASIGQILLNSVSSSSVDGDAGDRGFHQAPINCTCPNSNIVTNTNTSETFCTIQAAIDDAQTLNGHTITVGTGTYIENVTVTKDVSIIGPKATMDADARFAAFVTGVNGPKANPAVEAIVCPPSNRAIEANPGANDLFRVLVSGVTINGLVIDGNNPALEGVSATQINGFDIDARRAVTNVNNANGVVVINDMDVRYNILQNFGQRAVSLSGAAAMTGNTITENVIRTFKEQGVLLLTNAYVDVTNNTVDVPGDAIGLHLQNFNNNGSMSWSENNITVNQDAFGMHANLFYAPLGTLTINDNTVNAAMGVTGASDFTWGINVWSVSSGATVAVTDNIVGSSGGEFGRGINLWNLTGTPVTVLNGTVGNSVVGINLDNVDPYYGAGANTTANVTGTIVTGGTYGIRARTEVLPVAPFFAANTVGGNTTLNLSGVTVSGAYMNIAAVAPTASAPYTATVVVGNDSEVEDAFTAGILVSGTQASATVENNDASIHSNFIGIDVDGGSAIITNNHIYDNQTGVRFTNGGSGTVNNGNNFDGPVDDNDTDLQLTSTAGAVIATPNNSFAGTLYGVENLTTTLLDATNNYWETPTGPGPVGPGSGAPITTYVEYCPWLDAPNGVPVLTLPVLNVQTGFTYCSIQEAIDAVPTLAGHTIEASPGVYYENVTINKDDLILRSSDGKAVTTIQGTYSGATEGTVMVASGTNGAQIGESGKGFTIIGVNGPGNTEGTAVYLLGTHDDITIEGNEIMANGDHGLLAIFNASIDGIVINDNMFTGQTFMGAEPGGCGFGTQFNAGNNVPRQLVTLGGGAGVTNSKNVTFTNNMVTGTAGGYNSVDACEQGNNLVTIDVIGAEIRNNIFNGTTTADASSLRTRGHETSISCNYFETDNLGANCRNIFFGSANPFDGFAAPNTLAGVASANAFPDGGAYLTPNHASSWIIYRSVAQATAAAAVIGAGQTANAAATTLNCPVLNENTGELFPTIQAAIYDPQTLDGHVISVPAGTYAENVVVNKELTIKGPYALVSGCDGSRGSGEAIVVSAVAGINFAEIFHVAASNVTISGFTIDGDNPLINSGFTSTNGADIDAAEGVTVYETLINNVIVENNVFQNLSYFGVTMYDYPAAVPSSGHKIINNKFQNLGTYDVASGIERWGGGVLLYNNQYALVQSNCMDNVRLGVQTGNFSAANPGAILHQQINGNTMTNVRRVGVFHNLHYNSASQIDISANYISGTSNANETKWNGVTLSSLAVSALCSNNNVVATGVVTQPSTGIEVWNVKATLPTTNIEFCTITDASTGIFLNNYDGYESNATDGAHAVIRQTTINPTALGTGIRVYDNPLSTHANVEATIQDGVIINACANGLVVENASASVLSPMGNVAFVGQTSNYIKLINNTNNIDATTATFDTETGATATLAENFAIEDKILHKIDDALGFVLVKAGHDFVTVNSFNAPSTTIPVIQRGVDAASSGFTVNVGPGIFTEPAQLNVNENVTILGGGTGVTTVKPAVNTTLGGNLPSEAFIYIDPAATASIQQLTVDCAGKQVNHAIQSRGVLEVDNCVIENVNYAQYHGRGIVFYKNAGNSVTNTTFNNIERIGIHVRGAVETPAPEVMIDQCIYNGKGAGTWLDYGVEFGGGGKGTVTNSEISNCKGLAGDGSTSAGILATTFFGPGTDALIENNKINNNTDGISVGYDNADVSVVEAHDNDLSGNTDNAIKSVIVATVDAECNWYGFEDWNNINPQISGNVDFSPWITSGGDGAGLGFQPTGDCDGTPVTIVSAVPIHIYCGDATDAGSILVTFSGGTPTYTVDWGGIPETMLAGSPFNITGLTAGNYTITVTDTYGSSTTTMTSVLYLPVTNVTDNTFFTTIQGAINAGTTGDGEVIEICSGTYAENVVVNKKLTVQKGGGATKPLINGTGTDRVIEVSDSEVTLNNLNVQFNQSTVLHGIYAPSSGTFNDLTIQNCLIEGTGTTGAPVFGSYGIRLGDFGGPDNDEVTLTNNEVKHIGTSPLGRAVRSLNVYGTWDDNILSAWYSIQGGDFGGGLLNITNSDLTGVCEINHLAFAGTHTVSGNNFYPSNAYGPGTDFAQIELKNISSATAFLTISDNDFNDYTNFGVFSGRANNVTLDNNTFDPLSTATNYRSVRIDTKQRTTAVQGAFSSGMTLLKNTFSGNGAGGQTGIAVEIANSDNVSNFSGVTMGTAANENVFEADNDQFIVLNDETGSTVADPIWLGLYVSTKAKVTLDVDGINNTFDVGSGQELPSAMSLPNLFSLEDKIQHKIDDGALGFVLVKTGHDFVTVNSFTAGTLVPAIQRGVDAASTGFIVNVGPGTFIEPAQLNVNENVTILGGGTGVTTVSPALNTTLGGNLPSEAFIYIDPSATASIQQLTVDCAGKQVNHAIQSRGVLEVDNCVIENVNYAQYHGRGIVFYKNAGNSVTNTTFNNIERIGIHVRGAVETPAPEVMIDQCIYNGKGAGTWLDYGVEFGGGGKGTVTNSEISNCKGLAGDGSTSAGILATTFFGPGTDALIENNKINNNTDGISVGYDNADVSVVEAHDNDLSGNTDNAIKSVIVATVDAECNWYGTIGSGAIAGMMTGSVDFTPYLLGGTDGSIDRGFQPTAMCDVITDFYVNDNNTSDDVYTTAVGNDANLGTADAPFLTIQHAINVVGAGDDIFVDAGSYTEQVQANKSLSIIGADRSGPSKTQIKAPAVLNSVITNMDPHQPIIYASGAGNTINISQVLVDGDGGRNVADFMGVYYYEANGTFDDSRITGIRDVAFSGNQSGVAFVANHAWDISLSQTVTVSDNQIDDYQKGGILINELNTQGIVTGNTVTGQNIPNVNGQNGIQFGYGAYGTITGNTVTNNLWNEPHPHTYVAAGILLAGVGVDNFNAPTGNVTTISGNTISGNESGLLAAAGGAGYNQNAGVTYGGDIFANNKIHTELYDPNTQVPTALNTYDKRADNPDQTNIVFGSVQYGIDYAAPLDELVVSAHTFNENVILHESVDVRGANYGIAGCSGRGTESHINGGVGIAVDITSDDAKLTGFQLSGSTGVRARSHIGVEVKNNKIDALAGGIDAGTIVTAGLKTLELSGNCIDLASQAVTPTTPTVGVFLTGVSGVNAPIVSNNTISDAFYGYLLYDINATPATDIDGGTITGVMQGVAIINIDPISLAAFASSKAGAKNITMSGFTGAHPALPSNDFHAGVYTFTGGPVTTASITSTFDNLNISGTGKHRQSSAAIYLGDFSDGADNRQNIIVNECTVWNNLNRGIHIRGANALADINRCTLTNNGGDPYGLDGNDGFGIIAREASVVTIDNCYITNPATVLGGYTVTAMAADPGTSPSVTITATSNSLSHNGNLTSKLATNGAGGTFTATCNWWGSAIAANITPYITGAVTFEPYHTVSTDIAPGTPGFQPDPLTCNGCTYGVTNLNTSITYCNIQPAIDAVQTLDLHVLSVAAGTYAEQVNVTKDLTIQGPNLGINGNAVRNPEAIIVPPSELNLTPPREWSTTPLVTLSVDGITIDGLKISGDNPLINGYAYALMNVEAGRGVRSIGNDITFQNNIVEKFTYMGFHAEGGIPTPTRDNLIVAGNKFDNIHDLTQLGFGFAMYIQATAGDITNNTVTNSRTAIQVQPYQVVQGTNGVSECSNNNFSVWRSGIYYNYAEVGASAWTIDQNIVTASQPPANPTGPVLWSGIRAETMRASGNGGTISNNNVNGAGAVTDNIKWWGTWGMDYRGDASTSTQVFFTSNTVSNVEFGFVHTAAADIVLTGNILSASNKAISIQREYSSAGVQSATVGGAFNINATGGNTINGVATGGATLAQLFTIEDAINHEVDNSLHGLVQVIPNELYVTTNSFGSYATPVTTAAAIQRGVNASSAGFTLNVNSGTYDGQVVVDKSMIVFGTTPKPMIDFTGTVSGKPTLFDITANDVTIDQLNFKPDLTKLSSAIIASAASLEDITIINNDIDPYQSTPDVYLAGYSNRNAISINYGGSINYTANSTDGVDNIIVDNNSVTATVSGTYLGDGAGDIGFRSAVSVDYGAGTFTNNTFQSINHDILVRYTRPTTPVLIGGMGNGNTFNGGGVQVTPNGEAGGGVEISHNIFDGSVVGGAAIPGSVLRLQNNQGNNVTAVSNNTFNDLRWGMSIENFQDVTVANNLFNPLAGYTDFRHITVNTKCLSSDSPNITQDEINGTFTGNTFNSLTPAVGGTAMSFYNHDSEEDMLGDFTVGTPMSPNIFMKDFTNFIYLSDHDDATTLDHPDFPEYSEDNLGASSGTPMDCWTKDINIESNTFDVGLPGMQNLPINMTSGQRVILEGKLWHKPDVACLGKLTFFKPLVVKAKVFLQGPYDTSNDRMADKLRQIVVGPLFPMGASPYDALAGFVKVNNSVMEEIADQDVLDATDNPPALDNAIVDWIWVELRASDGITVVATRSALLKRDGYIVDVDGVSNVQFPDTYEGDYFLMIRHRNHLAAMTDAMVTLNGDPALVDFSSPALVTEGTTPTSARKFLESGVYGLYAGNTNLKAANNSWAIKYNGGNNDRTPILTLVGTDDPLNIVKGYYLQDVNLNGETKYSGSNNDRIIILGNVGIADPLNVLNQEPNN